jgi:hypothetical protein
MFRRAAGRAGTVVDVRRRCAVWRKRRGFRRLADELAEARVEQAELRRRVEAFEMIAAAAGAAVSAAPDAPVPPVLVAAARERRSSDVPVRLDVANSEVFAVVGGPGDPREWWTAIWQLAVRGEEART